jgi:integrase/recombinase XerD
MITFKIELANVANRDGQYAVRLRITADRKHKRVSLGFLISKKDHNPKGTLDKANWVRATCPQYHIYNQRIRERLELVHRAISEAKQPITLSYIADIAISNTLSKPQPQQSFIDYYKSELINVEARLSIKTAENYGVPLRKLIALLESQNKKDLFFNELTPKWLKDFETHLLSKNVKNTVSKQLGYVQTIVKQAISDKMLSKDNNPFDGHKFSFEPTEKLKLTEDEFQQIEDLELSLDLRVCHARDIFLFMYYTHGMRIGDALFVKVKDIYTDGPQTRLKYQMQKTKTYKDVLLSTQALSIVIRYRQNKQGQSFLFPFLKNELNYQDKRVFKLEKEAKTSIVNNNLKKVAERLGWDIKLTCHIARHTFADNARRKGVNTYSISKALGHTRLATTEQYLKTFDQKSVDSVNDIYEVKQ